MPPRIDKLPLPQRLQAAPFTHPNPNVVAAYTLCRTAEDAIDPIQGCSPPRAHNETEKLTLIHVRILGHLFSQNGFLSDAAISAISNEILRGEGAEEVDVAKLDLLGEF